MGMEPIPQHYDSFDELYLCLIYAILDSGGKDGYQAATRDGSNDHSLDGGRDRFTGMPVPVAVGRTRGFQRSSSGPQCVVSGQWLFGEPQWLNGRRSREADMGRCISMCVKGKGLSTLSVGWALAHHWAASLWWAKAHPTFFFVAIS